MIPSKCESFAHTWQQLPVSFRVKARVSARRCTTLADLHPLHLSDLIFFSAPPHHCTQPQCCRFTTDLMASAQSACPPEGHLPHFSATLPVRHSPATLSKTPKTPNSLHSSCSFHVPGFMFLPYYLSFSYLLCTGRDFCPPPSPAVSPMFKNCAWLIVGA